ncbi:cobalamin (vitamin B12) biosynthesis CbiM protein [Solidesulfovibrio carbinoliphilus subsp. oakridgensis]|uniref:Cobalamin (Vitamin B12) biosynthesis CbiM protein n=1 Tax=Solidesulfovibrio carbinoliphilus subsp. oakridgensis TaxID=694327 RepID=G7QDY1_9BACT|nr:cobalt transporter CbiM [Solidesulfovibrio carbinoliphilus]EHJ46637.1 cobalamin (vitamin B12) biosynthesis CbiM protein [Solidesulfovibrio carbinoliphilus subsp. oakridgensis]
MHISEGVLSGPVLAGGWALAAAGTALGLRRLDYDRLMTVAILAAAFFVASLIHVPIGPVSVHLILNGLLGAILGPAAFPAICIALLLQAVLFQFGGLVVLGVNTVDMALPAILCFLAFGPLLRAGGRKRAVGAFCCGFFAVLLAGSLTALALALSGEAFAATAKVILLAHVPIMLIEGVLTAMAVAFVARVRPEMLHIRLAG